MWQRIFNVVGTVSLLSVILIGYYLFSNQQRIVYVDSAQLINGFSGMQVARKEYQRKATAWKTNIDSLGQELQRIVSRYEKDRAHFSKNETRLSEELIQTKRKQLVEYQRAITTQAQSEEGKVTQDVIAQINAYLKKYGQQHRYKIILAATDYGNVAYAEDGLDITKEVLEGLNKEYSGQ
jgi:outer membrane protein